MVYTSRLQPTGKHSVSTQRYPSYPSYPSYEHSCLNPGVKSYKVSLEKQTADVVTKDDTLDYDTVLQTIKKTDKAIKTGEADGEARSVA